MKEFLMTALVLIVMIGIAASLFWLIINGTIFIFESWILLLVIGIVVFFIALDIVLFTLPLLFKAIPFVFWTFVISSYVYGTILWLFSVYISYKVFGIYWLLAGILLGGVGVIPIALFGSFISQWWPILYLILFLLVLTFITRYLPVLASAIILVFEERFGFDDISYIKDDFESISEDTNHLERKKLSEANAAKQFVEEVRNNVKDIKDTSNEFQILANQFSVACSETRLTRASERHLLPFQLHFRKSTAFLEEFMNQHEKLSNVLIEQRQKLNEEEYIWLSRYKSNVWSIQQIASEYSYRMFKYTHFDQDSLELVMNLRSQIDSFVSEMKEVQRKFAELNETTPDFVFNAYSAVKLSLKESEE